MEQQNSTLLSEVKIEPDDAEYPSLQTSWMTGYHAQETKTEKPFTSDDSSDELEADGVTVKFEVGEVTESDTHQDEKYYQHYTASWEMEDQTTVFKPTDPQPPASSSTLPLVSCEASHTGLNVKCLESQCNPLDPQPSSSTSSVSGQHNVGYHKSQCNSNDADKSSVVSKNECEVCSKTFRTPFDLAKHKIVHGEPHVCKVCYKTFAQASSLKTHTLIHTSQKPHVCDVCDKVFFKVSSLKEHQVIHTGKNPRTCDVCNKVFSKVSDVERHKQIHAGQKPHVCGVCSKAFTQASSLKRHTLVHAGQKPHVCDVCGKGFVESGNLKKHKRTHMKDNKKPRGLHKS